MFLHFGQANTLIELGDSLVFSLEISLGVEVRLILISSASKLDDWDTHHRIIGVGRRSAEGHRGTEEDKRNELGDLNHFAWREEDGLFFVKMIVGR